MSVCEVTIRADLPEHRLTVSVVDMDITLWNMRLQPDECLLSMESLREDSLWDTDMHPLLVAGDRKCRQGTFSASVSLLKRRIFSETHMSHFLIRRQRCGDLLYLTCIWNE